MRSTITPDEEDRLGSLAVVLPLALAGFVAVSGGWSLFAVAGVYLTDELSLSGLQFGLLLALPMAVGATLAVPAGLAAQKFGARQIMMLCLGGLAVCMLLLMGADSFAGFLLAGAGLGLAGGYYSAGLQFVTQHSPPYCLGLVLGVFGAGITGVGVSYYLVPLILDAFSWQIVPLAYLIVLVLVLVLLTLLTDDDDACEKALVETSIPQVLVWLARVQLWRVAGWFGVVAGSFFAMAFWLPDYLSSQFELSVERGALMAQWFVIPGALAQVLGGFLADRVGSARVISRALLVCLAALFLLSYPPMTLSIKGVEDLISIEFSLPLRLEIVLIMILAFALGTAMAGLQRKMVVENREATAFTAGVLLVSACTVAFLLPLVFGAANDWFGVRNAVFMILFLLLAACLVLFARDHRRSERRRLLHPGI